MSSLLLVRQRALVCVSCLSLNLISPNGRPEAAAQSGQCVGGPVNARSYGSRPSRAHARSVSVPVRAQLLETNKQTESLAKSALRCEMLTRRGPVLHFFRLIVIFYK